MKFKEYLKEQRLLITLLGFIILFPGILIAVAEEISFYKSNALYGMMVSFVLSVIYIGYDYTKRKHYYNQVEKLEGMEDIHFNLQLPHPDNMERMLYDKLFNQLGRNYDKLISKLHSKTIEDIDFIENWVHEMKTPIAAMKLIIENGLDAPNEKTLFELSDQIVKIEDMVQKVMCYNQINDLSRDYQIERINVGQVFHKCLKTEYAYIHHKHIQLECEGLDFEVNSDEKWLGFIFKQILDNAIKYSYKNGRIKVYGKNEMNHQVVIIEDFGVGIKGEDKRRIFEKGFTGANGRKAMEATGVGLYLAYKLAKKLGHKIEVESEFGKGTKVSVRVGHHDI